MKRDKLSQHIRKKEKQNLLGPKDLPWMGDEIICPVPIRTM